MQIEISDQSKKNLKKISEVTGFSAKDVLDRALMLFYLSTVKDEIELEKEFADWEKASDEDFENFEKAYN